MLTDAILCSSIAELLVLRLTEAEAILVSVVCMAAIFGKNALSAAIDDKSVVLSITSPAIDVEHSGAEANGTSLEAVATLTLL